MSPQAAMMLRLVGTLLAGVAGLWGVLALWYRSRGESPARTAIAAVWALWVAGALAASWYGFEAAGSCALIGGFALLVWWWRGLRPSNRGDWADDLAQMTCGVVNGDRVTLHNVRNFEWRTTTDYTPRWETRSYDLGRLRSVDMIMSYWRGPAIAHMLISFGFADRDHVVFSVEIRRKRTQAFSEVGGFFKEFELAIVATDELDAVRLRTDVRGERVYLYRLRLGAAERRALFLGYVGEANRLVRAPRFYHTITVNCTTLVYQMMRRIVGPLPLSLRLLFSGYMPEYVYAAGGLERGFSLETLRQRGFISERARRVERAADYSAAIRAGIPGIDAPVNTPSPAPGVSFAADP